jgi:hypothetical protein
MSEKKTSSQNPHATRKRISGKKTSTIQVGEGWKKV